MGAACADRAVAGQRGGFDKLRLSTARFDRVYTAHLGVSRGVAHLLQVPGRYYDLLEERLAKSEITVKEDMARLRELNILVDFDDKGCVHAGVALHRCAWVESPPPRRVAIHRAAVPRHPV